MNEERLPRKSWIQEVTRGIRGEESNNMEWVDREERRKIKLGTESCANIDDTQYIKNIIFVIDNHDALDVVNVRRNGN